MGVITPFTRNVGYSYEYSGVWPLGPGENGGIAYSTSAILPQTCPVLSVMPLPRLVRGPAGVSSYEYSAGPCSCKYRGWVGSRYLPTYLAVVGLNSHCTGEWGPGTCREYEYYYT